MRELTETEKAAIAAGEFEEEAPVTSAVTIEFKYMYRDQPGGAFTPTFESIFSWEEMLFPATISGGDLVVSELYIDNPVFFSSTDSPSPEVTGTTHSFLDIGNDTLWWNPQSDMISGANNRDDVYFKTIVAPPQLWAMRIKKYTFAEDGSIEDIQYYALQEEGYISGGIYKVGYGKVLVTKEGSNYHFPVSDGVVASFGIIGTHSPPSETPDLIPAETVLPEGDSGQEIHLLSNAAEAAEYQRRVTLTGGTIQNDVYADRQRARENLAEALWG